MRAGTISNDAPPGNGGDTFAKTRKRDWNKREQLEQWRERWAEMGTRALERAGYEIEAERWKHGHKPLEAQGEAALQRGDKEYAEAVNRKATTHPGPHVDAIERKRIKTERGNVYRDVVDCGETPEALRAELVGVDREIAERKKKHGGGAAHR